MDSSWNDLITNLICLFRVQGQIMDALIAYLQVLDNIIRFYRIFSILFDAFLHRTRVLIKGPQFHMRVKGNNLAGGTYVGIIMLRLILQFPFSSIMLIESGMFVGRNIYSISLHKEKFPHHTCTCNMIGNACP